MQVEVREVKAKLTGLDKVYSIKLETNDPRALELEKYIAVSTVNVEWEEHE